MKKLLILLVLIYVSLPLCQLYNKKQFEKKHIDKNWVYLMTLINGNESDNIENKHVRANNDKLIGFMQILKVKIKGNPTPNDIETLTNLISQINQLIAPKKIEISENAANIELYFHDKDPYLFAHNKPDFSIKYSYTQKTVYSDGTNSQELNESGYYTSVSRMSIDPRVLDQAENNKVIVQRFTNHLIGLQNRNLDLNLSKTFKENLSVIIMGHIKEAPNYSHYFKQSIFNSHCKKCYELTDADKYIIKASFSDDFNMKIKENSTKDYFKFLTVLNTISFIVTILLVVIIYLSGLFNRGIFYYIDNNIHSKWIAINCKAFTIALLYYLLSSISRMVWMSIFNGEIHILFSEKSIIILLTNVLCIVNSIFFIEKVLFKKIEQFAIQQFFSFLLLIVCFVLISFVMNRWIFPNYEDYNMGIAFFIKDLYYIIAFGIARFLYNYFNYQKRLAAQEKEQEITILREQKTRAELNALQSKINPHFLYNALNSIAGLAHENADKVEQMALALSKLFRYSINKDDDDFTTIQNEVEMVQIYLDIEKVRFGEKLQYLVNIEKGLEEQRIPKFIIQPLVENAIKHGISKIVDHGLLKLDIYNIENQLHIRVSDNGADFPEDIMTGYGLQNIYEKLDILYPNRYDVSLQNGKDKNISVILK